MTEDSFTIELVSKINIVKNPYLIGTKVNVLYELSISKDGNLYMGVDHETGVAVRGKGKGFQQDIAIYRETTGHTSVVPFIILELKYSNVTTHDVIVYSHKADLIKRIYPSVRFGLVLGNFSYIPARVLRLGSFFDFIISIKHPFVSKEIVGNDYPHSVRKYINKIGHIVIETN